MVLTPPSPYYYPRSTSYNVFVRAPFCLAADTPCWPHGRWVAHNRSMRLRWGDIDPHQERLILSYCSWFSCIDILAFSARGIEGAGKVQLAPVGTKQYQ